MSVLNVVHAQVYERVVNQSEVTVFVKL